MTIKDFENAVDVCMKHQGCDECPLKMMGLKHCFLIITYIRPLIEKYKCRIKELEQRDVAVQLKNITLGDDGIRYASCPNCADVLDVVSNYKFCGNCGQAVKWE